MLYVEDFNRLASGKLGFEINVKNPYKLCDFKPTFGKIFEDYLTGYDFWGYFDIDIIFGQMNDFISDEVLTTYDVISTYQGFLSGPFSIFRNTSQINCLFRLNPGNLEILKNENYLGFDENIQRENIIGFSIKKIIRFIQFLSKGKNVSILMNNFKEFRYQFQWYYKSKTIDPNHPSDMTEIIGLKAQQNIIDVHFGNLLHSDRYYKRIRYYNWCLNWKDGKLIDSKNEKEIFAFHFVDLKNQVGFVTEKHFDGYSSFFLTSNGISHERRYR